MDHTQLPLARLGRSSPTDFKVIPDAGTRAQMAQDLGIIALRKVRLEGSVSPVGKHDWRLDATLGMTAVQECVVSLEPVTTRIDRAVTRVFRVDVAEPSEEEVEMPEDDTIEPLPNTLNLMDLLREAVALALPDYPRAEGVALGEAIYAAPGVAPMTDQDAKPLAGLAGLRDKLAKDQEGS